jgi:hypothetical protein
MAHHGEAETVDSQPPVETATETEATITEAATVELAGR